MLDVRNLSFSYGKETIFDNTRLTAIIGELTIIKGESGSGKTTLLDILALKYGIHCDFSFDNLDLKIKENKKIIRIIFTICHKSQYFVMT